MPHDLNHVARYREMVRIVLQFEEGTSYVDHKPERHSRSDDERVTRPCPEGRYVRANGIDIHIVKAGMGEPLVLLHPGLVSNSLSWKGFPIAYST